jgi:AraC family transcriptional regulator
VRSSSYPAVFESVHRSEERLRYHGHGSAFATIVLEGAYTEVCNDIPSACPTGTIVVHDSAEEHADYFTTAGRCLNVELERPPRHVLPAAAIPGDLRAAVDDLVRAFYLRSAESSLGGSAARLQHLLNAQAPPAQRAEPSWLNVVIDRFDWAGAAPLRDAAALADVHPAHFSREFHRKTGETPNAFRCRARVRRASELLLATSERIASIALACGFNDQSHLTRTFHATLGLSPARYQRVFAR